MEVDKVDTKCYYIFNKLLIDIRRSTCISIYHHLMSSVLFHGLLEINMIYTSLNNLVRSEISNIFVGVVGQLFPV